MSWTDAKDLPVYYSGRYGEPPSPRNYHTATLVGRRMYVIGGTNGNQFFDDVHAFDLQELSWSRVTPARSGGAKSQLTARSRHSAVAVNRNIYIFGGVYAGFGKGSGGNDIYILDTENSRWVKPKVSGRVPQARFAHSAAVLGTKMYIFGGHDGARSLNDLFIFDTAKNSWTQPQSIPGTPPPPSHNYVMVPASGDLYVIGGSEGFDTVYRLRLYPELVWDVATCTGMRPSPRHQFSCTVAANPDEDRDSVYIFGGGASGGQLFNDTFVLDVSMEGVSQWHREPVSGTVPGTRIGHSSVYFSDGSRRLLVVFGGTDRQTFLSDLYILDLDALMELSPVDVLGSAPLQRVGHTATLLSLPGRPPEALVYGGDCTNNVLDDMTMLKQSTTGQWTWEATPIVDGTIRPRVSHTSAFVPRQQKVFVFGGGDLKSVRADLWSLDISKSKWRWQDLTGKAKGDAPSARAGHTMTLVEHGGEQALFVIGGFSEREYRADVYKLDITPGSTKTWTLCLPASASGLESLKGTMMTPRLGHTTCLVRQRLLIFGGSLKGSALDNDLYEFNPISGAFTWQKLRVHGDPPCPRYGHTSTVVEGVRPKMFVVGGLGAPRGKPELLNDVFVYDVETTTWSEPKVKGQDSFDPRCRHTAVLGPENKIIIFGGCLEEEGVMRVHSLATEPSSVAGQSS